MSRFQFSVTSEASATPMRQLLKMKNRLPKTAVLLLLLLGCNPGGAPSDAAQTPPAAVAHATTTASPETTADKGALTGVLLLKTDDGPIPVADIKIAIGQTLRDDEGAERIVAYEPSTAPVAYTDAAGRFVFEELQSGRYGLILDVVLSAFLLYREGTTDAILFEITAGEVTDLGRLEYSELPLPQSYR